MTKDGLTSSSYAVFLMQGFHGICEEIGIFLKSIDQEECFGLMPANKTH